MDSGGCDMFMVLFVFLVRSLVAYLAAANLFAKDHLEVSENRALLEKAKVFYTAVSSFIIIIILFFQCIKYSVQG